VDTVGGTSLTVYGTGQVGPTATSQWFPNANFGASGVISVGTSPGSTSGYAANYPGGFYFGWSGNTGTLSAYATCSTATTGTGAGGANTITNIPNPWPTVSPGGYPGTAGILYGTNGSYVATVPDSLVQTAVASATTTQMVAAPGAGKSIYVWALAFQATGAETAATVNMAWGTGVNCGTGTVTLNPVGIAGGASAGQTTPLWSSAQSAGATIVTVGTPASAPMVLPANNALCGVTAGTTIVGTFVAAYAIH